MVRQCPNCEKTLNTEDVFFDEKMNLICDRCKKPVIAAVAESENEIIVLDPRYELPKQVSTYGGNYAHESD